MTVTPKRFYLMIFIAVVVLIFAAGIAENFSFFTMLKRTFGGLLLSSVAGAALAAKAGVLLARLGPVLARYGIVMETRPGSSGQVIIPGFLAVVSVSYIVFTVAVPPHGTNITPDYLRKAHLSDRKLVALSGVDVYNRKEIMAKYGFFLDPDRLDAIPEIAISKIRNPDNIREAAMEISREYGSLQAKDKTEAFRRAVKRLYDMGKEDQLCRLYYGIRERAKDKGSAPDLGTPALIEIIGRVNGPRFLEGVMLDRTAAMEVRSAAARKLGKSVPMMPVPGVISGK